MFAEIAFWVCLGLVAYAYVGYPAGVFLVALILNRTVRKADIEPRVTVVISAFNEEREIERTVMNKLSQDYPPDRMELIVVSDGSSDRTDEIVLRLAESHAGRVKVLRQEPRQGKTQALNMAIGRSSADVIVFADANSIYAPNAIRMMARNFADPSVGYVTGKMVHTNVAESAISAGSDTYLSYEGLLRTVETRLGSIVGVDGGIDAVRRELYVPMRPDQLPDFVLPLSVIEQGKRVVYEPDAVSYEPALSASTDEFRMRVRVSLRALWGLYDKRGLLNPLRFPLFAWQLASHKVLRYVAFLPLAALLLLNVWIVDRHPVYLILLVLQLGFYAAAALGHVVSRMRAVPSYLLAPYYFMVLNLACVMAFWKFMRGEKMVLWTPRGGA
jgi:cellulose synthase/poly-beta-1,6-N-acetylglucosamine synthase-like glycosyltransferase